VRLRPEYVDEYKECHAKVWPEVLKQIKECNICDCMSLPPDTSIMVQVPQVLVI
jgi:L-rhamnose mutarotase